jgi:hypothetical protein
MNTEKLNELGKTWKDQNDAYDAAFMALIDAGQKVLSDDLEKMKKIQDEIFDLESEIYKILE